MPKIIWKCLLPVALFVVLSFQSIIFYKIVNNKALKDKVSFQIQINDILNKHIVSSISNNNLIVHNSMIASNTDSSNAKSIFEYISLPCLVIYIPNDEICMTCVDFAINKVRSKFPDFGENSNILLLTSKFNPNMNARIYGKQVFHFTSEIKNGFGITADNERVPQYFLLTVNKEISLFFTPNSACEELSDIYLEKVNKLLKEK